MYHRYRGINTKLRNIYVGVGYCALYLDYTLAGNSSKSLESNVDSGHKRCTFLPHPCWFHFDVVCLLLNQCLLCFITYIAKYVLCSQCILARLVVN